MEWTDGWSLHLDLMKSARGQHYELTAEIFAPSANSSELYPIATQPCSLLTLFDSFTVITEAFVMFDFTFS